MIDDAERTGNDIRGDILCGRDCSGAIVCHVFFVLFWV